jgi:hypothetical protein
MDALARLDQSAGQRPRVVSHSTRGRVVLAGDDVPRDAGKGSGHPGEGKAIEGAARTKKIPE